MSNIQRTFIPGDEWVYYKIYCGIKTADEIITEVILPLTRSFETEKIIDKWFFLRFSDSDVHIRVRLHLTDIKYLGEVLQRCGKTLISYIDQKLVWNVMLDTYERELERYFPDGIEFAESFFYSDSKMISEFLTLIEGDEGEDIRWQFAFKNIDTLFTDFRLTESQKTELIEKTQNTFNMEFGMDKNLKIQIDSKFRKIRTEISKSIQIEKENNIELLPIIELLQKRSFENGTLIKSLYSLQAENYRFNILEVLPSYIHMSLNRLFKSNQRFHEMILYNCLSRYYKSEQAKNKFCRKEM
jgi:thiopeptide-type bacteriocin biosynthesis protein